jgi:hypothetical protein
MKEFFAIAGIAAFIATLFGAWVWLLWAITVGSFKCPAGTLL